MVALIAPLDARAPSPVTGGQARLRKRCRVAALHFLGRYVFELVPDQPLVTERIAYAAAALAVESIGGGPQDSGARRNRAFDPRIGIVDVQVDRERRAAERLRPDDIHLRVLVRQ